VQKIYPEYDDETRERIRRIIESQSMPERENADGVVRLRQAMSSADFNNPPMPGARRPPGLMVNASQQDISRAGGLNRLIGPSGLE